MATEQDVIDYALEYGITLEKVSDVALQRANAWVAKQVGNATVDTTQREYAEAAYTLHLVSENTAVIAGSGEVESVSFGPIKVSVSDSSGSLSGNTPDFWYNLALEHLELSGLNWLITVAVTR
jgi:hypothetical protein